MFNVSEQQAFELTKRCEAIKEISAPNIYGQIEGLVKRAVAARQLTDEEVNLLYELLNRAIVANYSEVKESLVKETWDEKEFQEKNDEDTVRKKDMRNHILLCNQANLRTVNSMRRCIKLIATPEKKVSQSQGILGRRGR